MPFNLRGSDIEYTHKESKEKTHSICSVIQIARMLLKDRYKLDSVCIDNVNRRPLDEIVTMQELNVLVATMIDDTLYYAGQLQL